MAITHLKVYGVLEGMKGRCYNPHNKHYKNYGGRGIKICDEWLNNSSLFIEWALKNGYKQGLTIDRIDNNKGYSPQNCRWVTRKTQQRNRRSNVYILYKGEIHCKKEWCDILGISTKAVDHCRKRYKMEWEDIFNRYTKQYFNAVTQQWENKTT